MGGAANQKVLSRFFPDIAAFRPQQEEAIDRVASGQNSLCLMPTGAGKSLVYQVAGIRRGGTTLVLTPLVALMAQQSKRLRATPGVRAVSLSDISVPKRYDMLRSFDFGDGPNFVFTSPERLSFDGFLGHVLRRAKNEIGLVVVDEAHCVSQWGHTFRPAYKAIPRALDEVFGPQSWPPVLCLTATLNPLDTEEICKDFRIDKSGITRSASLVRKNLHLHCESHRDEKAKKIRLEELLASHTGEKCIVYVHRKESEYGTQRLAEYFREKGIRCEYFDADRKDGEKREVLAKFESGALDVVFATSAFGMGIDVPDIRVVIHYLLPESIEQYYQEVGRAGRDGKPAHGYLLFSETNKKVRRQLIAKSVVKRAQLEEMFASKLVVKAGQTVRSIDPFNDIVEERGERAAWCAFQLAGVVTVVARGPLNIQCFRRSAKGTVGALEKYLAAGSKSGLMKTAARKLGIPLQELAEDLWRLYAEGASELVASPSHGQFFTAPSEVPMDALDAIDSDLQSKLDARIARFEELVAMVEAGGDPTDAVCSHLGISREGP